VRVNGYRANVARLGGGVDFAPVCRGRKVPCAKDIGRMEGYLKAFGDASGTAVSGGDMAIFRARRRTSV